MIRPSIGAALLVRKPLTALIGRNAEIADVRALLDRSDVHLVTLTGPGGAGKTRLSLDIAHLERDNFADGVVFVSLANLSDGDAMLGAVAQSLNIRDEKRASVAEALADSAGGLDLLLILDNLEQIDNPVPALSLIFDNAPDIHIMVFRKPQPERG